MPTQPSHLPYEDTTSEESKERAAVGKRKVALLLLTSARSAVDLMLLAGELDLEKELDELAGTSPKRQRLLQEARARLDEEVPRLV